MIKPKGNKKEKLVIDHNPAHQVSDKAQENKDINNTEESAMDKKTINKVEKLIIKDVSQHSEQIVSMCIKSLDNASQNREFTTQIVNNYLTNWNLILDDMWDACAKYTSNAVAAKDFEGLYKANMDAVESFNNILKQASLVNSQIALDCCNEVLVPSLKQTVSSVEKLKKCYYNAS